MFRSRALHAAGRIEGLQTGPVGRALLPLDWVFLPIVELYDVCVR